MGAGTFAQGSNVLKETMNRAVGLLDLAGSFSGVRPYKQIQVRVVILRDESGQRLCLEDEVHASLQEMSRIFSQEAHVRVQAPSPQIVTLSEPAPLSALNVHCDDGAWQEDFDIAGSYFRRHTARTRGGRWLGYGAPVTVFIVRDISNKGGCSLGPLTDYVTLEAGMLSRARHRLLAHEVAHACGLWHSKDKENLMYPRGPGDKLTRLQEAVLRNSRHVTLL
jgi:hypothetical protein